MATISSHILDSVFGGSAVGIRCQLFLLVGKTKKEQVFDVEANEQGRVVEEISANAVEGDYEIVFQSGEYFRGRQLTNTSYQIVEQVVVRFTIGDPECRYHIPVMLSAHSYSVWWSKLTD